MLYKDVDLRKNQERDHTVIPRKEKEGFYYGRKQGS